MPETDLGRVDFQRYFLRWNSVLYYPNPSVPKAQQQKIYGYWGDLGTIPCHQHKTVACGALVHATSKYPPRVCPGCGVDTETEEVTDEDLTEVMNG